MTTSRQLMSLRRMSEELEKLENKNQKKYIQRRHSTISYETSHADCLERFETALKDAVNVKHKIRPDVRSEENFIQPVDTTLDTNKNVECQCSVKKYKGLPELESDIVINKNLPPNVTDIDTGVTDFTVCGVYAQDIMKYLKEIETKWVLRYDFLRLQRETNSDSRAILIDWIINVQVDDLCKYLMNLALIDHEFVVYLSSEVTAAALLLSRYVLKPNVEDAWTANLEYYTGYKRHQLDSCVRKLAVKLLEAEISKYQGPRLKFAIQSKYNCISRHPALCVNQILQKAIKGMLTTRLT
ncbi:putative cyclin-A3-1 [Argonauta hians]